MFTSYYGNLKKLPAGKVVAISQGIPKFYTGAQYRLLAPSWQLIKLDEPLYIPEYERQVLSKLHPQEVYEDLFRIAGGPDAILLCYEKPSEFCHRRLVARWLEKALGIVVPEWGQEGFGWYGPIEKAA